jgi:MFS superfamily sulfate permease-like transporter
MHIPAGLAYGALTSLSPVNGLYTSFYCSLVYVFFGTSRHLSVGTYAVTSLMVFSSISRLEEKYLIELKSSRNVTSIESVTSANETLLIDTSAADDLESVKLRIATALAFWCGIFQVI